MADRHSARVALNILFREVALSAQKNTEHAKEFNQSVQVESVEDYLDFVNPGDATACIEQILSRTRSCFYTTASQFRGDFERILANAMAYNSHGHGRHAYQPIIDWAQDLLGACCEEIEARHGDIMDAEKRLKDALEDTQVKSQAESPKKELALSSLEALIAACEVAAEQEGLPEDQQHGEDQPGQLPCLLPPFLDMNFDQDSMGSWPFAGLPLMQQQQLGMTTKTTKPNRNQQQGGKRPSAPSGKGNDSASRCRRHKSKVFIRPNKVVYLPTTFMEENFDAASLPVNCMMIVETNGVVQPEPHTVTIKAVPRQGLSTMYCMTNVMMFQQQFLNWQILDWTKVDSDHIKIHLQGPNEAGSKTFDDSPKSVVNSSKRKGSGSRKEAMYDSAAADEDEDGSAERDEAAEDGDSNPEAPALNSSGSHGRSATAKSARTSLDRKPSSAQNSDSNLRSLQGNAQQQQLGLGFGVDHQMDLRSNEDRLSPSNSIGEISDPPIQPGGGHALAASTFAGTHLPLLMAQLPQTSIAMQLQHLQYQQALIAAQQQQFAQQQQQLSNNGCLSLQQQLLQQQLQLQHINDDSARRSSALPFSSSSVPNLPMPDLQQQQQNHAMLLLNQILSGNTASAYGSAPSSLRMPAQDLNGPEALSAFKKYKIGSQGATVSDNGVVFSGTGPAPAGGLGLIPSMGLRLASQQQQSFDGCVVPSSVPQSFSL